MTEVLETTELWVRAAERLAAWGQPNVESEKHELATFDAVEEARLRVEKAHRARKKAKSKAKAQRRKAKLKGWFAQGWEWLKCKAKKVWDKSKKAYRKAVRAYQKVKPYVMPVLNYLVAIGKAAERAKLFPWLASIGAWAGRFAIFAPVVLI